MALLADVLAVARAKLTDGRFGPATTHREVNGHDRVEPDALTLIAQAGSTADAYTLARVVASECGTLPVPYAFCICEGVQNACKLSKVSILHKVTTPGAAYPLANPGYYGEQRTRWCASRQDPRVWHHEVAKAALAHPELQLAQGAVRWISCKVQDGGVQNGKPLGHDAAGIIKTWGQDGYEWIGPVRDRVTGIELLDPYLQCMFKHVGKGNAQTAPALAMLEERRRAKPPKAGASATDGARDADGESILPVLVAGAAAAYFGARYV